MGLLDYILIGLIAAAVVGVVVYMAIRKKQGKGCCGGCSGDCSKCNRCSSRAEEPRNKSGENGGEK